MPRIDIRRRTALRFIALIFFISLVQGCSSVRGGPSWDPEKTLASTDSIYSRYLQEFFKEGNFGRKADIRNEYIAVRMGQLDRSFNEYKNELYYVRVGTAVGFDLATLGLAGTAAAVSDPGTKTGAAALAALLSGTKTSIDKNIYFDRTLPAILSQMDGLRSVVRARLLAGVLLPADRYSISEADSDLSDYQQAGTIYGAISAITTQSGQAQLSAEKVLRERLPSESEIRARLVARGFHVEGAAVTDTSIQLKKCLLADGTLDPKVAGPLQSWLAIVHPAWVQTLPPGTLMQPMLAQSNFISLSAYEPLRQLAFSDRKIGPLLSECK